MHPRRFELFLGSGELGHDPHESIAQMRGTSDLRHLLRSAYVLVVAQHLAYFEVIQTPDISIM